MKESISKIVFLFISLLVYSFLSLPVTYAQETMEKKYEDLKKEYQNVVSDRDNILRQAQSMYEYKQKYEGYQDSLNKLEAERQKLKNDLQARLEQNSLLQQKVEELERKEAQLVQDKESLKNSLEKMQIEYKIVPETNKKTVRLEKENTELTRRINGFNQKLKRLEEEKLDSYAQYEVCRRELVDSRKNYDVALAKNRELEKKAVEIPARFAELARENKVLIKETAIMHYNLGVFYTQNKEYSHAVKEFEKAIELNPDDAYSHFNLGYIYAEHLVDRTNAIEHFRKYLRLSKADDKDVDWVKKYILTWQTWEGKKPLD